MYPTSGTTLRADINAVVMEAYGADAFFIGPRAMPPLGVEAKAGTYPKVQIAAGELLTNASTVRSRGSAYGKINRAWTGDTYDCVDRGLEEAVDDTDTKDLSRFFNLEVASAQWVRRNVQLDHEVRVAAALMNATTFGAGTNSAVAYTEANIATINFPLDVLAAVERVNNNGVPANTIVLSSTVFARIRRATPTVSWVQGSVGAGSKVDAATLAASFADAGITQVLVGRARYNSAKKGQSASMSSVWGNTYAWVGYVNPNARTPQDGGAGFTFYWNAEGGLFVTETYRDESVRSNMVRVRQNTTEKITDATSGTLITTQYA